MKKYKSKKYYDIYDYMLNEQINKVKICDDKYIKYIDKIKNANALHIMINTFIPNVLDRFNKLERLEIHNISNDIYYLPPTLKSFKFNHNQNIDELMLICPKLEYLECGSKMREIINYLPPTLKSFSYCHNQNIDELMQMCNGLEYLECGNDMREKISYLPKSLKIFIINTDLDLGNLLECCKKLEKLICNTTITHIINYLPKSLKVLNIYRYNNKIQPLIKMCKKITELSIGKNSIMYGLNKPLSKSLKKITLCNIKGDNILKKCNELTELILYNCLISYLPLSINSLSIHIGCYNLETLLICPNLFELDINLYNNIVINYLPNKLKKLSITSYIVLNDVLHICPVLEELYGLDCRNANYLPSSLKILHCSNLDYIDISYCNKLESLDCTYNNKINFPSSLKKLNINMSKIYDDMLLYCINLIELHCFDILYKTINKFPQNLKRIYTEYPIPRVDLFHIYFFDKNMNVKFIHKKEHICDYDDSDDSDDSDDIDDFDD